MVSTANLRTLPVDSVRRARSRMRPAVGVPLLALVLGGLAACSSAAPAGPAVATPGAPKPSVAATSPAAAAVDPESLTVRAPQSLGGRPRLQTGGGGTGSYPGVSDDATASASGAYGNPAEQNIILLVSFATGSGTAESRLSNLMSVTTQQYSIASYRTVEPGPLGGLARCGDGTFNEVQAAVCLWSDAGTTGMMIASLREADDFSKEFAQLRGEVETAE